MSRGAVNRIGKTTRFLAKNREGMVEQFGVAVKEKHVFLLRLHQH